MATDELATKLSRRLQMEGEGGGETPEQPGLNGAAAAAAGGWLWNPPVREANRMALESLGGADNSLGGALAGFVSRDLPESPALQALSPPSSPATSSQDTLHQRGQPRQQRQSLCSLCREGPHTLEQLSSPGCRAAFSLADFRFSRTAEKQGSVPERYDAGRDGFIDLMELKLMMEKLGAPQTHLGLKNMIKEVDEDFDSKLSFREFLLIFRKAAAGELQEDSGLCVLARLSEIDVSSEGVKGAKSFFEAKVQAINVSSRFEEEIKAEQEERKKQAEEMKQRKAAFKELQSTFK
ncbi:hypothetical protein H8958_008359 [Nasalis larvatus]